jgi:hypothetical protein
MKMRTVALLLGLVSLCLALPCVTGCKSTPKVDWNSRVGSYTYDQAVIDLGAPDKAATLSDGRWVSEWITHTSGGSSFSLGVGGYGSHTGVGVGQTIGGNARVHSLRLTFGTDGILAAWSKN